MADPTKEQKDNIEQFLDGMLESLGISASYSNRNFDGIEDGFQFRKNGEKLTASELKEILNTEITRLQDGSNELNHNNIYADRLIAIRDQVIEGNTGISIAEPYAIISDEVIMDSNFQSRATNYASKSEEINQDTINEEAELCYTHQWETCIDVSNLKGQELKDITDSLNWLEEHYSGFQETIWNLQQGIESGVLDGKVEIKQNDYTLYDRAENSLDISFKPHFYMGVDSNIYNFSLNELLNHELQHAAQQFEYEDFSAKNIHEQDLYKNINPVYTEIKDYLINKGINKDDHVIINKYIVEYSLHGSEKDIEGLDPLIINDKKFQILSEKYLQTHLEYSKAGYDFEDDSMDKNVELRALVGKPPRGHYHDNSIAYDQIAELSKNQTLVVYRDAPEVIVAQEYPSWPVKKNTALYPLVTGDLNKRGGSLSDLQQTWTDTYNQDAKNISSDEWKVIDEVRHDLFEDKKLSDVSDSDMKKIQNVISDLKSAFNKTPGNDALSEASIRSIKQKDADDDLPSNINKGGWSLE